MKNPLIQLVTSIVIASSTFACRTLDQAQVSDAEASETQPSAAFTTLCEGPGTSSLDATKVYRLVVEQAFAPDPPSMASNPQYAEIRATHSCADIWHRLVAMGDVVARSAGQTFDVLDITTDVRLPGGFKLGKELKRIEHLEFLRGIPNLGLQIALTIPLSDFDNLPSFQLYQLTLFYLKEGAPESATTAMIKSVGQCQSLRRLAMAQWDRTTIDDLAPLIHIEHFQYIQSFGGRRLTNIEFLKNWSKLRSIDLRGSHVADLSPLENALELQAILVSQSKLKDIDPLMGLGNLQSLVLYDNPPIESILALQFLPNLRRLNLKGAGITDISVFSSLTELQELDVTDNPVTSIESLSGLPIRRLTLGGTNVTDLSPLADMPKLVDVSFNSDITKFPLLPEASKLKQIIASGRVPASFCALYTRQDVTVCRDGCWQSGEPVPACP